MLIDTQDRQLRTLDPCRSAAAGHLIPDVWDDKPREQVLPFGATDCLSDNFETSPVNGRSPDSMRDSSTTVLKELVVHCP